MAYDIETLRLRRSLARGLGAQPFAVRRRSATGTVYLSNQLEKWLTAYGWRIGAYHFNLLVVFWGCEMHETSLENARGRLTVIWLIGGGIVFLILAIQTIMNRYDDKVQEVWSWFLPNVAPTISLMLGVLGTAALATGSDGRTVKLLFYNISLWLSVAYLVLLGLIIALEPLSSLDTIQLYKNSNFFLAPFQGIVAGVIGVLFASQDKKPTAP